MGINNITLSPELLAALYPDSLVLPGDKEPAAPPQDQYRFLGNNGRKLVAVVYCAEAEFLPDEQLAFLTRILAACQCRLADIALLNAAREALTLPELKKQLHPEMLFVWGVPPEFFSLPGTAETFAIQPLQGMTLLRLPSLTDLMQDSDQQMKKKLWNCLQKIFQL